MGIHFVIAFKGLMKSPHLLQGLRDIATCM